MGFGNSNKFQVLIVIVKEGNFWIYTWVVMIIVSVAGLRTRVVVLASQEAQTNVKPKRKAATQHGGSMLSDLQQSLEDHLPVLLGLVKEGP
ncbi:hypothetical protein MKW98_032292 [Papaver atlanticum]|uniref:Uncharacterized protein n=1 Tax=Papaver atlanticum TaxID=357466 RepID=A0AAD4SEX3_9MAGN|nr:hypothetical protein MKW98_032292 [Papaver atlanticum]